MLDGRLLGERSGDVICRSLGRRDRVEESGGKGEGEERVGLQRGRTKQNERRSASMKEIELSFESI